MRNRHEVAVALKALLNAARQTSRILRLSFPKDDGPPDALLVANRLLAEESMSRDFVFTVELLSDTPNIELKTVMGKLVTVSLTRTDGTIRHFSGHVFDFQFVKNDAGFAFYEMILRPWLAFLHHRRDCYIFHNQSIEQQTETVFRDYDMRDWQTRQLGTDERITYSCQWDESDHNYLHRRWEASGWHYRYEHRIDGHTLTICGDTRVCFPIDGSGNIEWQGTSGMRGVGISTWSRLRSVASTSYKATSFDFKSPRPYRADQPTLNKQGNVPALEVYEYAGAYGFNRQVSGQDLTRRRIETIEAAAKHFEGGGNDDHVQAGRTFKLTGHPVLSRHRHGHNGDNEFVILEARHICTNNFETGTGAPAEYRNEFKCIRRKIPWRPTRGFSSTEPKLYGLQTAIVVGPAREEIFTDEHARVCVQFHWDREGKSNECSSAWMRVASSLAGDSYGHVALPRVGHEVLVQWLDGNPDRPLIIGRVYNGNNTPPRFSHQGSLPSNKALSGWSTREVGGQREQQLRFDDTTNQISTQLASDHGKSQLNLGNLTHPRREGAAEARGAGFELRSDDSGAIRSAKAMLISAWKRLDAAGNQLDADEHVALMQDCLNLFKSLGQYAAENQATPSDLVAQTELKDDVQAACTTGPGGAGNANTKPTLNLSAPSGVAISTPKTLLSCAGVNIDSIAQQHQQQTAGGQHVVNAGKGVSMFAHQGGVTAVAHRGKLLLQSQHDETRIDSATNITLGAAGGRLCGMAQDEITLITAGGAYLKLSGGNVELGGPGRFQVKTAGHDWAGPNSMTTQFPTFFEKELKPVCVECLLRAAAVGAPIARR